MLFLTKQCSIKNTDEVGYKSGHQHASENKNKKAIIIKMISIPIGEIYAQVAKAATSYYSLIVLPLTNFTLHTFTCCVIDKGIKGLV